ncbi:hypothetical protein [Pseudovibrio sp. WM33]|uniref:hypothetical protein n=1 Tax=Pseudovibrio sp. WM33 TaxID=1735585 RepID=UPI0007AE52E2|nr:hypothetical protein [Pseudovibrio sp. WM33]KZL18135.1 hypothetical protein PsWM33_05122 [Pseudovibrio sp. WM33]
MTEILEKQEVAARSFNDNESFYAVVLFNSAAFEGAALVAPDRPEIPAELVDKIRYLGPPRAIDDWRAPTGYEDPVEEQENDSPFDFCHKCFKKIRDNIIHCNKAIWPEEPSRRQALLEWSKEFVDAVYTSNSAYSNEAKRLKSELGIENF